MRRVPSLRPSAAPIVLARLTSGGLGRRARPPYAWRARKLDFKYQKTIIDEIAAVDYPN
jgi:hypothetical protein